MLLEIGRLFNLLWLLITEKVVTARWAVALATRSGPEWKYRPMGRETVLTPVTWPESEFPTFENITGSMNGWELPKVSLDVNGSG